MDRRGTQGLAFERRFHIALAQHEGLVNLDVLGSCERGGGRQKY